MPHGELRVRPATPDDAATIVRFVRGLAAFEREPAASVRLTQADVLRDGFGDHPAFEVLIAERDQQALGFALFFPHYSTWATTPPRNDGPASTLRTSSSTSPSASAASDAP